MLLILWADPTVNERVEREKIRERLGSRIAVPTLPRVTRRVKNVLASPNIGLREVAAALATDPPLASRLLRNVNSAFYGFDHPILDLNHACAIVGLHGLERMMNGAPTLDRPGSSMGATIRHSVLQAQMCTLLCRLAPGARGQRGRGRVDPRAMYLQGLLHDIGRFAMIEALGQEYEDVVEAARASRQSVEVAEARAFGFAHTELGAMLIKRWGLPDELALAARHHHNPRELGETDLPIAILYVADLVASPNPPHSGAGLERVISPGMLELLGLGREELGMLLRIAGDRRDALTV